MEVRQIIESLQRIKGAIADGFAGGKINFDTIISELEEISDKLQSKVQPSKVDDTRRHLLKSKSDLDVQKMANSADYR